MIVDYDLINKWHAVFYVQEMPWLYSFKKDMEPNNDHWTHFWWRQNIC